jgi:hypothetical protein
MTSGNDDLEEALRQNLKLRRELAAEVAKAKGGGITYRLGWVLYWVCLGLIGLWWVFCFLDINAQGMPLTGGDISWGFLLFMLGGVPSLLYGLGRLLRYVLSGE